MEISKCMGCMAQFRGYPCPDCGYVPGKQKGQEYALPPETILGGKYLVGRVLGQGGFGITYIGWDIALERKVAIKEYYPSGQVSRAPGTRTLTWYTSDSANKARRDGMEMFLKEARKMAKVDGIPNVVRILDLFQENETAYLVMDFVEGQTLKSILQKCGPMGWEQAKDIFLPAIRAMEQVHAAGLVHRDLSPDNLMLCPDGSVRILDLGAAKDLRVNSGASSMQVAKGGFSPYEQYTQRGGSGPWTDVYAMAATIYYTLTGKVPPAAMDRMEEDTIRWDLPGLQALPAPALNALKRAMIVQSKKRTQTMEELEQGLFAQEPKKKAPKPEPAPKPTPMPKQKKKPAKWLLPAAAVLVCGILGAALLSKSPEMEATLEHPVQTDTFAETTTPATEDPELAALELAYQEAEALAAEGKHAHAGIAFAKLGQYRDARERSLEQWSYTRRYQTIDGNDISTYSVGFWLGVRNDGTVAFAGNKQFGQDDVQGWSDIVEVVALGTASIGLKADGTVVAVGAKGHGNNVVIERGRKSDAEIIKEVLQWRDIAALYTYQGSVYGLKKDGTMIASRWDFFSDSTDTGYPEYRKVQSSVSEWTDIVSYQGGVGLKMDGTVVLENDYSDLNPEAFADWKDIVKIDVSFYGQCYRGLAADGTVWYVSDQTSSEQVPGWEDIIDICGPLGLHRDGSVSVFLEDAAYWQYCWDDSWTDKIADWTDVIALRCHFYDGICALRADGTVASLQKNSKISSWTGIRDIADGGYTFGIREDGTVVVGKYIQCDVEKWTNIRVP